MSDLQQQPGLPGFNMKSRAVWEKSNAGRQLALALPVEASPAPDFEAWAAAANAQGLPDDGPDGEWFEVWDQHYHA